MKKWILGGALATGVAVAAAAAVTLVDHDRTPAVDNTLLAYIPDDTLFFVGSMEPAPAADYMNAFGAAAWQMPAEIEQEAITALLDDSVPDGVKVLAGFYLGFFDDSDPVEVLSRFGLGDKYNSALYSVGGAPVLRMELADTEAFWAALDGIEVEFAAVAQPIEYEGLTYRRYPVVDGEEDDAAVYLGVSAHEGVATLFLDGQLLGGDELRGLALGMTRPELSLADSGRLVTLRDRHGFLPSSLGYINHREIVRGITNPKGNRFGELLTRLMTAAGEPEFEVLRSPACHKDLMAIADNWPQTSFGHTYADIGDNPRIDAKLIIESHDGETMSGLRGLRGHVPSHLRQDDVAGAFSIALAIDSQRLGPFVQSSWQRFTQAEFGCPLLTETQADLRAQNPVMLGMFTSMLGGFKGISATVFDVSHSAPGQAPEVSGLMTVSAEDPQMLLAMSGEILPFLGVGPLELPADGSAVPVSHANAAGVEPMVALRGQHIVLYSGERASPIAQALADEALEVNGFMNLEIDYGRYGELFGTIFGAEFQDEGDLIVEGLEGLLLRTSIDFAEDGIVLEGQIKQRDD